MIDPYRSVQVYFAQALERATRNQRIEAGVEVRAYLLRLLERFGHGGRPLASIGEPLALLVQRATQGPAREAAIRHRELGDVALFMGGFFAEFFERRGISERYVHELGKAAYLRAAELA